MDRIKADSDVADGNKLVQYSNSLFDKTTRRVFVLANFHLPRALFPVALLIVDFLLHLLLDVFGQTRYRAGFTIGCCIVGSWILRKPLDDSDDVGVFLRLF